LWGEIAVRANFDQFAGRIGCEAFWWERLLRCPPNLETCL
jgi:hypothetical protein